MKEKTIYALGFFDGVHLGHQALLRACRTLAEAHGCRAGVVTFTNHPDALTTGKAPAFLNTTEDRRQLLHAYGIPRVKQLPFDRQLMTTHWSAFLTQLLDAGAAGFVCGSDFRFGADGVGTAKRLAAFCKSRNLPYAVIDQQMLDGIRVSSSHIRTLLETGEITEAVRFLGHPHILSGKVIPGHQLGRTLGSPTANLVLPEGLAEPRHGVYVCHALVDGQTYPAVTNIGRRPTVGGDHTSVEAWLLDFDGDLYGKKLTLAFHCFLRPEEKFDSLEDLRSAVRKDAENTRKYLEKT